MIEKMAIDQLTLNGLCGGRDRGHRLLGVSQMICICGPIAEGTSENQGIVRLGASFPLNGHVETVSQ